MDGAPKEKLLAKGGFVPSGLPDDFWSAMQPPLHPEVAEVVIDASHAEREPPSEVSGGVSTAALVLVAEVAGQRRSFVVARETCGWILLCANLLNTGWSASSELFPGWYKLW